MRSKGWTHCLAARREGRIVPSQEAPPRPGILRSFDTKTVHATVPSRCTNGVSRRLRDEAAIPDTILESDKLGGAARVRKAVTPRYGKPAKGASSRNVGSIVICQQGNLPG